MRRWWTTGIAVAVFAVALHGLLALQYGSGRVAEAWFFHGVGGLLRGGVAFSLSIWPPSDKDINVTHALAQQTPNTNALPALPSKELYRQARLLKLQSPCPLEKSVALGRFDDEELAVCRWAVEFLLPRISGVHAVPEDAVTSFDIPGASVPGNLLVAHPGVSTDPVSPVILHFFAGGLTIGSPVVHVPEAFLSSSLTGVRVVLANYSRVPEHSPLQAVADGVHAYKQLLAQGVPSSSIALWGESAGGYMVASVLQRLRDEGVPLPACGVLSSPGLDFSNKTDQQEAPEFLDPLLNRVLMDLFLEAILRPVSLPADHPTISPLYGSWEGLPPLYFYLAQNDPIYPEGREGALKARQQGVDVTIDYSPFGFHAQSMLASQQSDVPELVATVARMSAFVREHLGVGRLPGA